MAVPPSGAWAATYCVDGNNPQARDTNAGTEAQPWKTISKATDLLQPGDTLLVKAGTYRESVILTKSGTAAQPITIQVCPGHEGKAIINAAEPLTTWRKCTGPDDCRGNPNWSHIYYADVANPVNTHPDKTFAVRQVFQQGQLLPRSRYPDAGWRYPTSIADPKRVFNDSSLAQPEGYFAGAVCHIKTAVWWMDPIPITAFSRGTITLATSPRFDISMRFGYFITNVVGEINAEGEWAYDSDQKRVFLWPKGAAPEGAEFTYRDCCLRTNHGMSFNIVRGLTMRNAWGYGILVFQSHDITMENNTVEYSFDRGIRLQAEGGTCDNNQIIRNTVKYSGSYGIHVDGAASHYNIEGNHIYATGVEHFGDDLLNGIGEGLFLWGPHGRVYNNRVDRTARAALYLGGKPIYREIYFNHTSNTGLALSDGGSGLYTDGYHAGPEKDHIHHNIFADSIGCNTMNKAYEAGLPVTIEKYGGDSPGLYVDEEGNNRIIEYNTVIRSRLAGIYFHWAPGNLVRHNTLYGNGMAQIRLSGKNAERKALVEDVLLENILFATEARQRTLELFMNYNDVHFGQSDRNWFYHPYADTHIHLIRYLTPSSGEHHDDLTLSGWQALSGYDGNSKEFSYLNQLPQMTLARPVKSRIVYNASLDVNTIDLGPDLYCDVQGNGIRGKLVLQPFESKILIAAVEAVVTQQATNPVPADGA
jgi:parallel beta-helix repeat protein